jgi:hypothetical protein
MSNQLIGAKKFNGGWVGTVRGPAAEFWSGGERIARVTEVASTREVAQEAAVRWYLRADSRLPGVDGRFVWEPLGDYGGLHGVFWEPRHTSRREPVPLEPVA